MANKKVTLEVYNKIKAAVKKPKDDAAAIKKFGFGKTVVQTIRNTKDYQEYCERCFRFHGNPKRTYRRVVDPDLGHTSGRMDSSYAQSEAELDELIRGAKAGDKALRARAGATPLTAITILDGNIHINTI